MAGFGVYERVVNRKILNLVSGESTKAQVDGLWGTSDEIDLGDGSAGNEAEEPVIRGRNPSDIE